MVATPERIDTRNAPSLGYQPAFDGLRAIAVFLVIGAHYGGARVTAGIFTGGFHGVDLFFVLSGFLITVLLLEEWGRFDTISLRSFYARRTLRLFPALWAFLAVYVLVTLAWLGSIKQGLLTTLYAFTYTMNVLETFSGTANAAAEHLGISHLWSLGVEEQFYLLWPVTLLFFLRRRASRRTILTFLVTIIVAQAVVREIIKSGSLFRFETVLVGCVAAVIFMSPARQRLLRFCQHPVVFGIAAVVSGLFCLTPHAQKLGPLREENSLAFSIFGAVLVCGAISVPGSPAPSLVRFVLTLSPIVFLGRISYALYLWHQPVLVWFQHTRLETSWGSHPTALLALAASIATSTASYYLVERRFLRRKWRLARTASHDVALEEAVRADDQSSEPAVQS